MTSWKRPVRLDAHVEAGFSLVEVLVALVVLSVGLLGIAKMQALALSSTSSARMRSLAALEASSLASTMRADRAYWMNVKADPAVTFANGAISGKKDATLQANATCPCTPPQVAYNDLQEWVTNVSKQVPNVTGGVNCTIDAAVPPGAPVSCTISLSWSENQVISNAQQAGAAVAVAYKLFVNP
jgi:type IV pilus assembly protein PilV